MKGEGLEAEGVGGTLIFKQVVAVGIKSVDGFQDKVDAGLEVRFVGG